MTQELDSINKSNQVTCCVLVNCCVCGHIPTSFSCGLRKYKGCDITVWAVECDHDEESEPFPYVEHRLIVYGKNKQEAEERWNDINRV